MRVAHTLWEQNIATEFNTHENPKFKKQLDEVLENGIPFMVIIGEDELKNGMVKVKDLMHRREELVSAAHLTSTLLEMGCKQL